MKQSYHIQGMTCNGCRSHVEQTLTKVSGASQVSVNLEKAEAIIELSTPVSVKKFQEALNKDGDRYKIFSSENGASQGLVKNSDITGNRQLEKSKLQQLRPLIMILVYIALASVLLHRAAWNITQVMLDFMGLFYIVFSFFKLLDINGFKNSFSMYDPLARVAPSYGLAYPFIETGLGLMLLLRFQILPALVITIIVLGMTTYGVTKTLLSKKTIQCACLGTALKLPMTEATFIENALMIVMAIIMLVSLF